MRAIVICAGFALVALILASPAQARGGSGSGNGSGKNAYQCKSGKAVSDTKSCKENGGNR